MGRGDSARRQHSGSKARMMPLATVAALSAALLALMAQASVIGDDGRQTADREALPLASIGSLLDLDSGALCTASIVADDLLLTPAHCALRAATDADCAWPRTRSDCREPGALSLRDLRFVPADDHQIAPADKFAHSRRIDRVVAHGAASADYRQQRHNDWALLQLAEPLAVQRHPPLRVAVPDYAAIGGTALAMPGYSADRYYRDGNPVADVACTLGFVAAPVSLIEHDCDSTAGASGSPILIRDGDGGWSLIGLHSDGPDPRYARSRNGEHRNYGTPSSAFWPALMQLQRQRSLQPGPATDRRR